MSEYRCEHTDSTYWNTPLCKLTGGGICNSICEERGARVAELEAAVNAVREFLESDQMRYANTLYATHGGGPCWQKDGKTINEILDGVMEKGEDRG